MPEEPSIAESHYNKLPLGLVETVAVGFDAKQWKFLVPRLFKLTYSNQDLDQGIGVVTLQHAKKDENYDVPDGMDVKEKIELYGSEAISFRATEAVDDESFSLAVEASLKVEGVSAETSTKIATASNVEQDTTKRTTLVSYGKSIYEFQRADPDTLTNGFTLTDGFKGDVAKLPATFESANQASIETHFFEKWGTHYLISGKYGGVFVMKTVFEENKLRTFNMKTIEAEVKASFDTGAASGSAKTDIETSTKKSLNTDLQDSQISFYEIGGNGGKEVNDFLESVDEAPTLLCDATALATEALRPQFAPIHTLVADPDRQATLEKHWKAYLPADLAQDNPVFDPPSTETPTTSATTLAPRNGFALLFGGMNDDLDTDELSISVRATQDTTTPELVAGRTAIRAIEGQDTYFQRASLVIPVKQGTYYTKSFSSVPPLAASGFIGTALSFGDWVPLKPVPGSPIVAQTDGFLAIKITPAKYMIRVNVAMQLELTKITAGCSANDLPPGPFQWDPIFEKFIPSSWSVPDLAVGSLCVPILRETRIDISVVDSNGAPKVPQVTDFLAYWLPIDDPRWKFGPPQRLLENNEETAETDGFACGVLSVAGDGGRGYMEISIFDNEGGAEILKSGCSVHSWSDQHRVPVNTVMLPVSSGKKWIANVTTRDPPLTGDVFWFPVVPK